MTRPTKPPPSAFIPYSGGDLDLPALHEVDEDPFHPYGAAVFENPITDIWIHAELNLPQGEVMKRVKLVRLSKDEDGNIIGKYDNNPMLNTMVYDVELPDGNICEYRANLIAELMYYQVYSEGVSHSILSGILNFSKDSTAIQKVDQCIITKSGQHRMWKSTVG